MLLDSEQIRSAFIRFRSVSDYSDRSATEICFLLDDCRAISFLKLATDFMVCLPQSESTIAPPHSKKGAILTKLESEILFDML